MRRAGLIAALVALALGLASPAAAGAFADWAAVVVAGDWKGSNGGPTEAFDNARRDVSRELQRLGFAPANIRQFSVRPERYRDRPSKSEPRGIYQALGELSGRAAGGCLVYFTSHGAPQGVLVDETVLTPAILARMLDTTCGARPTVVVVSACYSGVFVRPLAQPNRMVLTAARPDRTSFGCGEADRYPYFDDCVLQTTPRASDFVGLASAVRACVAEREVKEGMTPPSEPQVWIGAALRPMLPLYAFPGGVTPTD
ncbi:MAG: C13 family peptidase [Phenylobacterium sp.]|jgi:hypothetical protein|uniref:C13 family peptidase n=1 Tax=Phenylobacterium sp. TaxID=1871053 RepID=UPI00391B7CAA